MSVEQLNRQRALNFLDAMSARDLDGTLDRCTDDVDFLTHAPIDVFPHLGPRHGKDELRELWRTVFARYSTIRYDIVHVIAEGDAVATYLRTFFTKHSNGRVVQVDMAVFFTFRDGRVAQIREIIDSYDLVQQVLEREIGPLLTGEPAAGA
jgi:ketosteroid isomerase-like protein